MKSRADGISRKARVQLTYPDAVAIRRPGEGGCYVWSAKENRIIGEGVDRNHAWTDAMDRIKSSRPRAKWRRVPGLEQAAVDLRAEGRTLDYMSERLGVGRKALIDFFKEKRNETGSQATAGAGQVPGGQQPQAGAEL